MEFKDPLYLMNSTPLTDESAEKIERFLRKMKAELKAGHPAITCAKPTYFTAKEVKESPGGQFRYRDDCFQTYRSKELQDADQKIECRVIKSRKEKEPEV